MGVHEQTGFRRECVGGAVRPKLAPVPGRIKGIVVVKPRFSPSFVTDSRDSNPSLHNLGRIRSSQKIRRWIGCRAEEAGDARETLKNKA
jgi:hypothetical protein